MTTNNSAADTEAPDFEKFEKMLDALRWVPESNLPATISSIRDFVSALRTRCETLKQEVVTLRGGVEGPFPNCNDCGERMVWDSSSRSMPTWICPAHVSRRMRDAEERAEELNKSLATAEEMFLAERAQREIAERELATLLDDAEQILQQRDTAESQLSASAARNAELEAEGDSAKRAFAATTSQYLTAIATKQRVVDAALALTTGDFVRGLSLDGASAYRELHDALAAASPSSPAADSRSPESKGK